MAKRFYEQVSVADIDGGYAIHLDGRVLKTPGKRALVLAEYRYAECVAAEWQAQEEDIRPETMPCTRLVNVAIEQTPDHRERLVTEARNYAATDLLCYRASEPMELTERQAQAWDPILKWATEQGIALRTTQSALAIEQDEEALAQVAQRVSDMDDLRLTLCVHLIAVYGSTILGLAVMAGHIDGEAALTLSRLDELWQIERWGEDEEAKQRADKIAVEVKALCALL